MRFRSIKDKKHVIYDNEEEFKACEEVKKTPKHWRDAKEGDWCISDDGQVLQILKKGTFVTAHAKDTQYVRTLLGTYSLLSKKEMGGDIPKNLYSFSRNKDHRQVRATNRRANSNEILFAEYVVQGIDPSEAYLKAYPTKNRAYARQEARLLLRQERVIKLIRKEVKDALAKVGITQEDILRELWDIISEGDNNSSSRVRSLELLAKISDMMPNTEKKSETLTVFQGFTPEQLSSIKGGETKVLAESNAEINED